MKLVFQIAAGVFCAWLVIVAIGAFNVQSANREALNADVDATYRALNK